MASQLVNTMMIPNSIWNVADFNAIYADLEVQLHGFNQIMAIKGELYWSLDQGALEELERRLKHRFGAQEKILMVRDGNHLSRYLIGPSRVVLNAPGAKLVPSTNENLSVLYFDYDTILNEQKKKEQKMPAKIPRPPNAYILYRAHHQKILKVQNPALTNIAISRKLGIQWQGETDDIRQFWKNKADAVKAELLEKYPNYKYTPRKAGQIKHRKKAKKADTAKQPLSGSIAGSHFMEVPMDEETLRLFKAAEESALGEDMPEYDQTDQLMIGSVGTHTNAEQQADFEAIAQYIDPGTVCVSPAETTTASAFSDSLSEDWFESTEAILDASQFRRTY
ncbi:hypothetical protein NKR23_g1581 [Pleurostoma richardsiae]|uniref:HMG box domain-containing protein n=1 Tax=Pleurostoma richardsiae TaxID=41990 RepID=A0AA38S3F3_9PEZI|nr:hypothetical protein NKR23_g1581 [Pleurostoma richardsiae]